MSKDKNKIATTAPASENESGDLYIGWMAKAPGVFVRFIRKYLQTLLILVIALAAGLALSQKKFSTGIYEYGQLTEITGIFFSKPIPYIKLISGKDIWGNSSYISIPLVGYGKHGAAGAMQEIEKEKNISLSQRQITLKGTLLYNDGKTILQVDKNDNPVTHISDATPASDVLPITKELGVFNVKGEIIDPKCYFGVMKPGEGKVHRDCAIRCILRCV